MDICEEFGYDVMPGQLGSYRVHMRPYLDRGGIQVVEGEWDDGPESIPFESDEVGGFLPKKAVPEDFFHEGAGMIFL
jgi:hypothetical protein